MAARRTTTARTTTRETKVTSRARPGGDVEVVERSEGWGLAEAMGIVTTILLLAAIVTTDYFLGKYFGKGLFFA
jgi:hypothetical protein